MIEATNLVKKYEEFVAVDHVSFSVKEGELMALLGPNGAGKTSTIRMVSSILEPTAGKISVNGRDTVNEADEVRRSIGMITEQPGLYERMSGMEYLLFYGRLYGLTDADIRQRSSLLFKRFGMESEIDRRLGGFSKGMKQKVGLIRAMLHNPPVLLLDEPTSAMDPHSARQVRESIQELRRDNRAIILTTHNLNEAEKLADRIAIISEGKIVAQGTGGELRRQLTGDRLMALQLDQDVPFSAERLTADLPQINIESAAGDQIRYRSAEPERDNPAVVRYFAGHGLGTVLLSEVTSSLEEIYLSIVNE